jgi:hypothetical protein
MIRLRWWLPCFAVTLLESPRKKYEALAPTLRSRLPVLTISFLDIQNLLLSLMHDIQSYRAMALSSGYCW